MLQKNQPIMKFIIINAIFFELASSFRFTVPSAYSFKKSNLFAETLETFQDFPIEKVYKILNASKINAKQFFLNSWSPEKLLGFRGRLR